MVAPSLDDERRAKLARLEERLEIARKCHAAKTVATKLEICNVLCTRNEKVEVLESVDKLIAAYKEQKLSAHVLRNVKEALDPFLRPLSDLNWCGDPWNIQRAIGILEGSLEIVE